MVLLCQGLQHLVWSAQEFEVAWPSSESEGRYANGEAAGREVHHGWAWSDLTHRLSGMGLLVISKLQYTIPLPSTPNQAYNALFPFKLFPLLHIFGEICVIASHVSSGRESLGLSPRHSLIQNNG